MPVAAAARESYTLGDPCAAKVVRRTSNGYVHTVAAAPASAPPLNINLFYFHASRAADAPLHRMILRPEIDAAMA